MREKIEVLEHKTEFGSDLLLGLFITIRQTLGNSVAEDVAANYDLTVINALQCRGTS